MILKSASASRSSGEWNNDDFDALADGVVVGRIMKAAAKPANASWLGNVPVDVELEGAALLALSR